ITVLALSTDDVRDAGNDPHRDDPNYPSVPPEYSSKPSEEPMDSWQLAHQPNPLKARRLMTTLAEQTGGYALFPETMSDLDGSITELRSVLQGQYVLAFKSTGKADDPRGKVEVKCNRKGVKLHYH